MRGTGIQSTHGFFSRTSLRISILRRAFQENMIELVETESRCGRVVDSLSESFHYAQHLMKYSGHTLSAIHRRMDHPFYEVTGYIGYFPQPLPEQDIRNIALFFDVIYDTTDDLSSRFHKTDNPYLETVRILAAAIGAERHDDIIPVNDYTRALALLIASQFHWEGLRLHDDGIRISEELKGYLLEHSDRVEHLICFLQRRDITLEELDMELLHIDHNAPALSLRDGML